MSICKEIHSVDQAEYYKDLHALTKKHRPTKCTCNGWAYKELKKNELLCVNCGAIEDYKPMFNI